MKKVEFHTLKTGQKFRYQRKLYVKDIMYCAVNLATGDIPADRKLPGDALVTPVKVRITVK